MERVDQEKETQGRKEGAWRREERRGERVSSSDEDKEKQRKSTRRKHQEEVERGRAAGRG